MNGVVPKGNYSLRVRGTSSNAIPSSNGAPVAGGELDDTAQMGAGPTDGQDTTAGAFGSADQTGSGFGYSVAGTLPASDSFTIPNTDAGRNLPSLVPKAHVVGSGPSPAPPAPSSNQDASAGQVIAPLSPTGGQEAPARFYFSSEGADSSVSSVGVQFVVMSVAPGTTTGNGTVPFGGGGGVGVASGGTLVSSNVGILTMAVETTAPFGIASSGVGAFGGGGGVGLSAGGGGFAGTVAGTSGQGGNDVSTTNVTTYLSISEGSYNPNVSLLSQFMASTFVASSAGYGYPVTAQAPANPSVFIAAAPPKA